MSLQTHGGVKSLLNHWNQNLLHLVQSNPQAGTPKASGVVRNPSPSVLPEYATPSMWEWDGVPYATIKKAANTATSATVSTDVKDWVMNVVRSFILRDVVGSYEALHQKMNE